ncbi:MAG: hypothetical protein AB1458_09985 [Bacteroidota bacterium]
MDQPADLKNPNEPKDREGNAMAISSTSAIIFRLLETNKNGEMLNRLKIKLGKTKEEIYQIISEL